MRRLILLRHGQAEPPTAAAGDFDRALTARGRAEARAAGAWLAERGLRVDLALVSPALRARQTWECAAEALPPARTEEPDSLYDADPGAMLALARAAPDDTVVVVAHNPGLHTLALRLAQAAPSPEPMRSALRQGLSPAALAVFGRDAEGRFVGEAFHESARVGASE